MYCAVHNVIFGTIFKHKGPSFKKKELHVNSASNTFQRKSKNFDEKVNCVNFTLKLPKMNLAIN